MPEERKIFTLTQLNRSLEKHFWEHFSQNSYWITAEIVNISHKNSHWYLELADSISDELSAKSRATIWGSVYSSIVSRVGAKDIIGILQPGNKILINVKIEYHKIYGLSLKIRDIDPNYSFGEIERKRQEVIKRLKAEGIFDNQKKVKLPIVLKRIALIGSPNTSGYRDFLNELFNNHDFNNFKIKEFSTRVQGSEAVTDIVDAIKEANLYDAEVIVIVRGGGSKMDLALFDDYQIAHAICNSRLPIITGIGHETDEVVADLVAKQFFITPTAVGKHIQYEIKSFKEIMRGLHDQTIQKSQQLLFESKTEFTHYNNYLSHYANQLIHSWRIKFQDLEYAIHSQSKSILFNGKDILSKISHDVSIELRRLVQQENASIDRIIEKLFSLSKISIDWEKDVNLNQMISKISILSHQHIEKEKLTLQNTEELLELLNPLKILSAGYTISTINNQDIKDVDIQIGDEMKTLSSKQLIISKVTAKENKEHGN